MATYRAFLNTSWFRICCLLCIIAVVWSCIILVFDKLSGNTGEMLYVQYFHMSFISTFLYNTKCTHKAVSEVHTDDSIYLQGGTESLSSTHSTGIAMLFSAGTFLYVSTVHVLPELTSHSHEGGGGQFSRKQLLAIVCGSLLPLFLTFGHHH